MKESDMGVVQGLGVMPHGPGKSISSVEIGLVLVLLVGAMLRIMHFPQRYEFRDVDERGYLCEGLLLMEGITPGLKASPGGFETWLVWGYAGVASAKHMLLPGDEERAVSLSIRPFVAVNHALWDLYHDMSRLHQFVVAVVVLVSLCGIWAAYRLGVYRAGLAGGLLLGGIVAVLPLFVLHACRSKPYSLAWSFGIIALYFAAVQGGRRRWWLAALFMGLAISTRIDMLLLLPVLLWEFWYREDGVKLRYSLLRVMGMSLGVAYFVSPWLMTNLVGNLRAIATVRLGPPPTGPVSAWTTLVEFALREGLLVATAAALITGMALVDRPNRVKWWALGLWIMMLFLLMFRGTGYGLRHNGATVIALVSTAALAMGSLVRYWPRVALFFGALAMVLPLIQAVRTVGATWEEYCGDEATAWVERHVPGGTVVYLGHTLHDPLPTPTAADEMWREVMDIDAWRRKFGAGLRRFALSAERIPRALSEEHMIQERANRRGWYILGDRVDKDIPRYEVRAVQSSLVFGVQVENLEKEFARTGGVVIWRDDANFARPEGLGKPVKQWVNARGWGTHVLCSEDVQAKLKKP